MPTYKHAQHKRKTLYILYLLVVLSVLLSLPVAAQEESAEPAPSEPVEEISASDVPASDVSDPGTPVTDVPTEVTEVTPQPTDLPVTTETEVAPPTELPTEIMPSTEIPTETVSPVEPATEVTQPTESSTEVIVTEITPEPTPVVSVLLPGVYESDDSRIQRTSGWAVMPQAEHSGGAFLLGNTPQDALTVTFEAVSVTIVYTRHNMMGSFNVELDGQVVQTIDSYADAVQIGAPLYLGNLASGVHTLRVYPVNGAAAIDAFIVGGDAPTATPAPVTEAATTPAPTTETPLETPLPTTPAPTETAVTTQEVRQVIQPQVVMQAQPAAGTTTVRFNPTDDAYVRSGNASRNYDSDNILRVRNGSSDDYRSYLKFNVANLNGSVVSARLRLYVTDGSDDTGALYLVGNSLRNRSAAWTETNVNWNNAPALPSSPIRGGMSAGKNTWIEYDVTGVVTANGVYSFALAKAFGDSAYFSAREASSNKPELVLQLSSGGDVSAPAAVPTTPAAVATQAVQQTSTPSAITVRLNSSQDTYVRSGNASRNYDSDNMLRVRNGSSDDYRSYLQFNINGLNGSIVSARLRLYVTDGSDDVGSLYLVSNRLRNLSADWTETNVNWNNAPALPSSPTRGSQSANKNTWVEYDVTGVVTGNGVYSFALANSSGDSAYFNVRESSSNKPELVLQLSLGSVFVPTTTPTSTPATPTSTPATPTPTAPPPTPTSTMPPVVTPVPVGSQLTWRPPTLSSPTTIDITTAQASVRLASNRDYILRMPTNASVQKVVQIDGGRNVVLIGGEIYIPNQNTNSITPRTGLKIKDVTGTIHIEGLLINGPDLTEGIQIDAPNAIVQIQNVRVENVHAHDQRNFSDNHPDIIQPYGGYRELRVDRLSGSSDYQALLLKADSNGPTGPTTLRNVNIVGLPTSRYLFWVDTPQKSGGPITLTNVWIDVPPQREGGLGKAVWPDIRASGTRRATVSRDSSGREYVTWSPAMNPVIVGRITEGLPPGGDFVPRSQVGRQYVSPGYAS